MSSKLRSVLFAIAVGLSLSTATASVGAPPPQAPSVVDSYTGCLRATLIVQVALGDAPAGSCGTARMVHLSAGDLTSLAAGTGLTGGGANGDISIGLAPGFRLPQACSANQGTTWNGSAWVCASLTSQAAFDSLVSLLGTPGTINQSSNPVHWTKLKGVPAGFADGTDDVGASYAAGFGLNLAGTTFSVEPTQIQRRVGGSCAAGSAIRSIGQDGTVTCQAAGGGGGGWGLTGTAGTNDSNFLGTTDDRPLNLKVNGQRALRLEPRPGSVNLIGGSESNAATPDAEGATIAGGGTATFPNVVNGEFSTIGGGLDNSVAGAFSTVSGGAHNAATAGDASVGGGAHNVAGERGTVSGGEDNHASGLASMVPGGQFNHADGTYSFAAGVGAHADHDGSFVWADMSAGNLSSTGANQFVVRAAGGLHLLGGSLVCAGCVSGADLADGGVSTSKLADGGVTPTKLSFDPATQAELDHGLGNLDATNLRLGRVPDDVLFGGYSHGLTFSNINNVYLGSLADLVSRSALSSPLQVQGATGQTAPLQAWGDATGTVLASIRPDGVFDGNGSALTNLNADGLATGTVPDGRLSADVARYSSISTPGTVNDPANPLEWSKLKNVPDTLATPGWSLSGNSGTNDSDFIGTRDDRPLNLKVRGQRALRLEPTSESPNVIGGHTANAVDSGAYGATIGGGGTTDFPNFVSGIAGTVGGGTDNRAENSAATVAGGHNNRAGGGQATIGGGICNVANGDRATISGGECNVASGDTATILGGSHNQASGSYSLAAGSNNTADADWSTVSGGENNHAGANHATVPGGSFNEAIGSFSFAAGFRAHANDGGSFVWGDSTAEDVSSTGPDQFVVQAHGGLHLLDGELFCDGCVTVDDLAPGTTHGLEPYCAQVRAHPQSYEQAPCRTLNARVDSGGDDNSITIGSDGFPVISYSGPKVVRCRDASCAAHDPPNTLDSIGFNTSIAIGTDGFPVVSYRGPNGALKVAHCRDAACAANDTPGTLDSNSATTSIAIGTDGNPVVSYLGQTGALKIAHCTDAACAAHDTPRTLDSVGEDASIAIGTDGYPVVSYRGPGGVLKIWHCVNVACSLNAEPNTLDTSGAGTSIAIGTDGYPIVSYQAPGGALQIAHCSDERCSANDGPSTLDSFGRTASIAIGTDRLPVVSYEGPGGAIKVVHCSDAECNAHEAASTLAPAGDFTSIVIGIDGQPVVSYRGNPLALMVARPAISN